MKTKRIIGLILAAAMLGTGCTTTQIEQTTETTQIETTEKTSIHVDTQTETAIEAAPEKELVPFEFNPHVYSATIAERVPQDWWDSFYNMCDALRAGEDTFECSSDEAYEWCMNPTVINNLFPAACLKIAEKSPDGTPGYEDGTGKIFYKIPADEFVTIEAQFEDMIVDILNDNLESDDTDYEKCLKLYLYIAENYDYDYEDDVLEGCGATYSTFMTKKGVCVQYGSVYAYLLLQVGIDAIDIGCFEDEMDHAWTYVVLNGKGYHVDTTWALTSCYGMEDVYLDYFLMSDSERNEDKCLVRDLTVQILPEFWVNRTTISLEASDSSYNIRYYCTFDSLDEENKILHYTDMYDEPHEFYYGE